MGSPGGGIRNYKHWRPLRDLLERALMPTDWPARLAVRLGVSTEVGVERHELTVPQALGEGRALRIAFATDFHVGPITPRELLSNAVRALANESPDLLLLGGDFVSLRPEGAEFIAERLATVPAPLGRYAVLGNHDHWAGASAVAARLAAAGIEVLVNRSVRLPAPFDRVSVCGLDDHTSGQPDATGAFAGAGPLRLLLMHAPSGLLDLGEQPFAVAFCGHTHGGQIALPGGLPIVVPHGALSRRYSGGRYDLAEDRTMFVSRGIGCSGLPLRLNARPSVLVCTLRGASSGLRDSAA
jgi:predicted MPP superfamily phosphohydrolase